MSDTSGIKAPGLPSSVLLANTFLQNAVDASKQGAPIDQAKSFRDTGFAVFGEMASRLKCAAKFAPVLGRGYNAYCVYEAKQEKNAELKRAKDTGTMPDQNKLNDCGKKMFTNALDMVSPPNIPVGTIVSTTVEGGKFLYNNRENFTLRGPESMSAYHDFLSFENL